jgi:formate hydrogenlyase transcriptional activator
MRTTRNATESRVIQLDYERLHPEGDVFDQKRQHELGIVGKSPRFRDTLTQIKLIAPTDCPALLVGETGTGKDLLARLIHSWSPRRHQPWVAVNCAAIPLTLLESELFGHERGAFTGALAQRMGRFELANKGTLFLDEVGDLPLEMQPKLLRVLQEHEFERLGGIRTIRTDVRLIAATHRDLSSMVAQEKFREDLFYRLNVFPIGIQALRDRIDDIPDLVRDFTRQNAGRLNKQIDTILEETMEILTHYPWPGNIRELQNFVQRAVIQSPGSVLTPTLAELLRLEDIPVEPLTLVDAERAHITRVLQRAHGQLTRAAALLGIPRTTLFYKMRRLGIRDPTRKDVKGAGE